MDEPLRWFGVKLVYRAFTARGHKFALAEESVRIVRARSFDHAHAIAGQWLADNSDESFKIGGRKCLWEGPEVLDVYEMCEELTDGAEIYSNMMVPEETAHLAAIYA